MAVRASCSTNDATDRLIRVGMVLATGTTDTHYPQSTTGLNYITYPVGPTASGTALTYGGAANTKEAYVQFVSSSPFQCNRCERTQPRARVAACNT